MQGGVTLRKRASKALEQRELDAYRTVRRTFMVSSARPDATRARLECRRPKSPSPSTRTTTMPIVSPFVRTSPEARLDELLVAHSLPQPSLRANHCGTMSSPLVPSAPVAAFVVRRATMPDARLPCSMGALAPIVSRAIP